MGIVTDIQRFSLNDGPGIRTTVFLKGCNARCRWCHNPETLSMQPELLIHPDRCFGCGACVGFDAHRMGQGLPPARDRLTPEDARKCFSGALTVAGRDMTADEVLKEVMADAAYYETSGGGVTLSGGECLMQPDFAGEILAACRRQGVHTAIETNLMYPWERLEPLLAELDLVMADIKLPDPAQHQQHTGIDNAQVLDNLTRLQRAGAAYIIRTPVIPGVSDRQDVIAAIARLVARDTKNLLYYELLNFNPLGASKYQGLGLDNAFAGQRPLSGVRMQALADAARRAGIAVRVG